MSGPLGAFTLLAVGLLPVLCFLVVLISLDSFKLVRLRTVLGLLALGALTAAASLFVNRALAGALELDATRLARYVSPFVEESLKGAIVIVLIARRRVGFLVDAAIIGFAVGAGFAAAENVYFFTALAQPRIAVWLIRGFGTAIMHGGVTASLAILSKAWADRKGSRSPVTYLPGWLLAVIVHSVFNHFILAPDLSTLVLLVVLPLIFVQVFRIGEARTREWLGTGFDTDAELLRLIGSGKVSESRIGSYLQSLKDKFPPTTVADIVCLLRLRLELSIRAKGILIMRKAGVSPPPDPEVRERFTELDYLEKNIGPTAIAALGPIFNFSDRDLWQYNMLQEGAGKGWMRR
jgi:RsiW-degrading membrane proteinase PrsW (M82 family)